MSLLSKLWERFIDMMLLIMKGLENCNVLLLRMVFSIFLVVKVVVIFVFIIRVFFLCLEL